jgi:hypothetical protein
MNSQVVACLLAERCRPPSRHQQLALNVMELVANLAEAPEARGVLADLGVPAVLQTILREAAGPRGGGSGGGNATGGGDGQEEEEEGEATAIGDMEAARGGGRGDAEGDGATRAWDGEALALPQALLAERALQALRQCGFAHLPFPLLQGRELLPPPAPQAHT